jgi:hypothetical protein
MKLSSALTNCFAKSVDVFLTATISAVIGDFVFTVPFVLGLIIYLASNVLYFRDGDKLVAQRLPPERPTEIPLVARGGDGPMPQRESDGFTVPS